MHDVHWAPHTADLLATASADTAVHVWDVRSPRSSLKLKALVGYTAPATLVRWAARERTLIASAHNNQVRVWDVRREAAPLALITAHHAKISGLGWSRGAEPRRLLSASHDRTIKLWDVDAPRDSIATLHTGAPLLRAAMAPVGHAVATVAARSDHAVRLWATSPPPISLVHAYAGHTDTVQALAWRYDAATSSGMQLVSLAADHTIRLWRVEPTHLSAIGLGPDSAGAATGLSPVASGVALAASAASGLPPRERAEAALTAATAASVSLGADSVTNALNNFAENRFGSPNNQTSGARTFPSAAASGAAALEEQPKSLDIAHEFGLLTKLPSIVVDRADPVARTCVVSCVAPDDGLVRLKVIFFFAIFFFDIYHFVHIIILMFSSLIFYTTIAHQLSTIVYTSNSLSTWCSTSIQLFVGNDFVDASQSRVEGRA